MRRLTPLAPLTLMLLMAGGCLERTVTITSDPEGALVTLNDQQIGRTPVETGFRYFGVYDVRLELEGYEPIVTEREAVAPIWEYPGVDLLAIAMPWRIKTALKWQYEMKPIAPAGSAQASDEEADLLDRARSMRRDSRGQ